MSAIGQLIVEMTFVSFIWARVSTHNSTTSFYFGAKFLTIAAKFN
jgi:hypothetical protein